MFGSFSNQETREIPMDFPKLGGLLHRIGVLGHPRSHVLLQVFHVCHETHLTSVSAVLKLILRIAWYIAINISPANPGWLLHHIARSLYMYQISNIYNVDIYGDCPKYWLIYIYISNIIQISNFGPFLWVLFRDNKMARMTRTHQLAEGGWISHQP